MFVIKFISYFSISFLLLALPSQKGTLFDSLYDKAQPMLGPIYNGVSKTIKKAGNLFSETITDAFRTTHKKQSDMVKERMSSLSKKSSEQKIDKEVEQVLKNLKKDTPAEEYTEEERELLKKIIRETQY